jgi:hypothetical protein
MRSAHARTAAHALACQSELGMHTRSRHVQKQTQYYYCQWAVHKTGEPRAAHTKLGANLQNGVFQEEGG